MGLNIFESLAVKFSLCLVASSIEPLFHFGAEETKFLAVFVDWYGFLADPLVDGRFGWMIRVERLELLDIHPSILRLRVGTGDKIPDEDFESTYFVL